MFGSSVPPPRTLYVWQVLDPRDGQWGTISITMKIPASMIAGNDDGGHNVVLSTPHEKLALGDYRELALAHQRLTGLPVRLYAYDADPIPVEDIPGT